MGFNPRDKGRAGGKKVRNTDPDMLAEAFAEAEAGSDQEPLFDAGKTYHCAFMAAEQKPAIAGKNEWVVVRFKGVGKHKSIGERAALFCVSSKSLVQSMKRLKPLVMALVGCGDLDEYNEFDPEGKFFSALLGKKNEMSKKAAKLVGKEISVTVTRGNETEDGDYYRNHKFRPFEDDSDEDDDAPESEEDEAPESEDEAPRKGKKRPRS